MSDSPLVDLAHAVLNGVVAHWPALPAVELPYLLDLPARQYVTVGEVPVADCEQLVVAIPRTFGTQGSPAREEIVPITAGVPWLRTAVFTIQILRCIGVVDAPAGQPDIPTPTQMDAEGSGILTDADTVLASLIAAHKAGELAGCGGIALEGWRAIGEQGGFAGGNTRLRLNLF